MRAVEGEAGARKGEEGEPCLLLVLELVPFRNGIFLGKSYLSNYSRAWQWSSLASARILSFQTNK